MLDGVPGVMTIQMPESHSLRHMCRMENLPHARQRQLAPQGEIGQHRFRQPQITSKMRRKKRKMRKRRQKSPVRLRVTRRSKFRPKARSHQEPANPDAIAAALSHAEREWAEQTESIDCHCRPMAENIDKIIARANLQDTAQPPSNVWPNTNGPQPICKLRTGPTSAHRGRPASVGW